MSGRSSAARTGDIKIDKAGAEAAPGAGRQAGQRAHWRYRHGIAGGIAMGSSLSELLLKAVRGLPQEEQDTVVRQLLDRHTAPTAPPVPGRLTHLLADPAWGLMPRPGERGTGSLRV